MTTGRINQVTILRLHEPPLEGTHRDPGRGGTLRYWEGVGQSPPGCWCPMRWAQRAACGHSIAPTEFPRVRSAAEVVGSSDRRTPLHTPSRWRVPSPGHACRRLPVGASPRGSCGTVAISQPSTDHMICPLT